MAKQKSGGLVWSTNAESMQRGAIKAASVPPAGQKMRIRLEKRRGKPTTVIAGFAGPDEELEALAKHLKVKAGTGGSAKDGLIIIQGDVWQKCVGWIKEWGCKDVK